MVAKATSDVIMIMLLSWLMLVSVSVVIAFLLQELPTKSILSSSVRVLIGVVLIGLWLLTWFKLVSFYFWRKIRKNYTK